MVDTTPDNAPPRPTPAAETGGGAASAPLSAGDEYRLGQCFVCNASKVLVLFSAGVRGIDHARAIGACRACG